VAYGFYLALNKLKPISGSGTTISSWN